MERPHAAPAGSNQWRGSLVRVRKGTTQGNTESRVGRPAVWSAVSALLLMVQVPNSEPVDRFLPRTGVGDLPHRRWLHLGSCRPSMTRRSGLARSAATSAYGTKQTCLRKDVMELEAVLRPGVIQRDCHLPSYLQPQAVSQLGGTLPLSQGR